MWKLIKNGQETYYEKTDLLFRILMILFCGGGWWEKISEDELSPYDI